MPFLRTHNVQPQAPLRFNTAYDTSYSRAADHVVGAGDDLQTAINDAVAGDIVEITAGVTKTGTFNLPLKAGTDWIYIRTSGYASLPAEGTRITDNTNMATLMGPDPASNEPTIKMAWSAHHYRFLGIEIVAANTTNTIVRMSPTGAGITDPDDMPEHITFDRCLIRGDETPTANINKGIYAEGRYIAVIDSYIKEVHHTGSDAQAINIINGLGPFKFVNNRFEGSGENIMSGGGSRSLDGLPADFEIRGNHFIKPTSWIPGHPDYAGTNWSIKNLFELKYAARLWMEGNIFENAWTGATAGSIVFTPRNNGGTPQTQIRDVLFENNRMTNVNQGFLILSRDTGNQNNDPTKICQRIFIRNNLFNNEDNSISGLLSWFFEFDNNGQRSADHIEVTHNTCVTKDNCTKAVQLAGSTNRPFCKNFVFRDNLMFFGNFGIQGDGTSHGSTSTDAYWGANGTPYVWSYNGLIEPQMRGHFKEGPAVPDYQVAARNHVWLGDTQAAAGFADEPNADYELTSGVFQGAASDGTDLGCNTSLIP